MNCITCTLCGKKIECSDFETNIKDSKERKFMEIIFKQNFVCLDCQNKK